MFETQVDRRNVIKTGLAVPTGIMLARGIPAVALASLADSQQTDKDAIVLPFR